MIEFKAGTFQGEVSIEKVTTHRDGMLSVDVKVIKTENAHVLLDNVNKICQFIGQFEGLDIKTQGEMVKLSTYRNGGVGINLVLPNDQAGRNLVMKAKTQGTAVIAFSSVKGNTRPDEGEPEQPGLDGLGDGEPE